MIEDFTARRRAAIEAQRLLIEEMKAEDERDHQIARAEQEFVDWQERERVKRQKYEQAMANGKARAHTPPATTPGVKARSGDIPLVASPLSDRDDSDQT